MNEDVIRHLVMLRAMKAEGKQGELVQKACDDAIEIWAPMAGQLGMSYEQSEMQNLAIELGYPEEYNRLRHLLQDAESSCEEIFRAFAKPISEKLDELGIEYTFKHRMKSVYSVWRKMRVDNKTLEDVYDLFASRIVFKVPDRIQYYDMNIRPENIPFRELKPDFHNDWEQGWEMDWYRYMERLTSWHIYSVIASLYSIQNDRIKDWISSPKPSGYQALHITVRGPEDKWIEIQIRSERMHYEAEHGIAKHWKYKQKQARK